MVCLIHAIYTPSTWYAWHKWYEDMMICWYPASLKPRDRFDMFQVHRSKTDCYLQSTLLFPATLQMSKWLKEKDWTSGEILKGAVTTAFTKGLDLSTSSPSLSFRMVKACGEVMAMFKALPTPHPKHQVFVFAWLCQQVGWHKLVGKHRFGSPFIA